MIPLHKDAITKLTWPISEPVPFVPTPPKPERSTTSTPELDHLRGALAAIPNNDVPYDEWFRVACAVHYATDGSDAGLEAFREWSARSAKHDDDFLESRVWPYIQTERGGEVITERSLFALAASHGWVDETVADDFEVVEEPQADKPKKQARFEFVQAAAFSAGKPPGWIIKNVLPRAELVCLYGESGAGKSFVVLDLLGAIARGEDWRGHRTARGLACGYIAAEGAGGIRNRLTAYAQHHGVALADLPIAVLAGAPNFLEADDVIALGKAMKAYGRMDVLVIDTLARVTAGANENSSEDMGRAIKHCETLHAVTGATIILVHHSGKDASRGARGWSGIKGALDCELEVTRCEEDRVLTVSKMKDGQGEGAQFGFKLVEVPLGMDEDGDVYGSCVVEYQEKAILTRKAGAKGKTEIALHKIVLDLTDMDGGPKVEDILVEYENRNPHDGIGRDTRRQIAQRALRGLLDKGILVADGLRIGLPEGA